MIIYKIKNKIDGKIYIGQTAKSLEERWKQHRNMSSNCRYLKRAIQLYSTDSFEVSIISRCSSIEEMNHREAYYIKLFNTLAPNGYNLTKGGAKSEWSEVSRLKSSMTHKKLSANGQNKGNFKKGQVALNKGVPHSEKAKIKMSQARKGIRSSPATEFKKGNHPITEFKKGGTAPNRGRKRVVISGKIRYIVV